MEAILHGVKLNGDFSRSRARGAAGTQTISLSKARGKVCRRSRCVIRCKSGRRETLTFNPEDIFVDYVYRQTTRHFN